MKKKIIIALWSIGFLLFIICAIIAQYRPFTSLQSGILMFTFSIFALTAMLLQTLENRSINHVISKKPLDDDTLKKVNRNSFIFKITFVFTGYVYAVYQLITRIIA